MNTPDTEWREKIEEKLFSEGVLYEDENQCVHINDVPATILLTIQDLLTSRDTYWKERVRTVVDENQGDYESKNPETNWIKAVPAATLLDNLK